MELTAKKRSKTGKSENKRLRKEGQIPSVIYGLDKESTAISLTRTELEKLYRDSKSKNTIFTMMFDDKTTEHVITYRIDRDALSLKITHVDFLRVDDNAEIKVTIPIVYEGIAPGTKMGGVLVKKMDKLDIKCIAKRIPHHITIELGSLGLGQSIRIKDIQTGDKFKILSQSENTVVFIDSPRNTEDDLDEASAETEGEETAAGETEAAETAKTPAATEG